MAEPVSPSMLEFLVWVSDRRRTYDEAMAAWQSTCPRHTVWEDALTDGLIRVGGDGVTLTSRGKAILENGHESMPPD
jgi:hypothetical protein